MAYTLEWDGADILARVDRAIGRSAIGIGERISATAKEIVHVQTGTLRRSIHAAPVGEYHGNDQAEAHGFGDPPEAHPGVYISGIPGTTRGVDLAEAREHLMHWEQVLVEGEHTALVEVGSWIDYACTEETGRHHYYIHPAVEMVLPSGWVTIKEAFVQEGLS